jgi:hypothetical protein
MLSIGMALLLLNVTIIQALHHHVTPTEVNDPADSEEYVYGTNTCAVCDYLSQHALQEYHLPALDHITVPATKPVILLSRYDVRLYLFSLQGFTNKGPPPVSRLTIFTS